MIPIRSFLAFPLPETLRSYLFQLPRQIRNDADKINWVKQDNIHITLNFLGETDPDMIKGHGDKIRDLLATKDLVRFGTTDTGIFPHANDPRVLWVGITAYDTAIKPLVLDLRHLIRELGYQLDNRKFQAHITLGRVKSISRKSTFIHDFLTTEVRDSQFTLGEVKWYKSTLTAAGAIYEELETFKLKTGGQ